MGKKDIQIPFGAQDSELKGWEYTIPEGMEAIIKDGKVIVREKDKESDDERIRRYFIWIVKHVLENIKGLNLSKEQTRELIVNYSGIKISDMLAWLEKQKEQKDSKVVKFDHDREQKSVEMGDKVIVQIRKKEE